MAAAATVTVITPTVGIPALERCIRSVAAAAVEAEAMNVHVMHVIVADGSSYHEPVCRIVSKMRQLSILHHENHRLLQLPFNTGANRMNGHRIYAAMPWLVNSDWVAYLDEDNWFDPTHLYHMLKAATSSATGKPVEWVHSLRKICDDTGLVLVDDNCESLGLLSPCWNRPGEHFVDTNCLLLRRNVACALSPLWDVPLIADRGVSAKLIESYHGTTSKHYSVNYTIGPDHSCGVQAEFFMQGNACLGFLPDKPKLYIFHFTPELTKTLFAACLGKTHAIPMSVFGLPHAPDMCAALMHWQMSQYDALLSKYALVDGYANINNIPSGSHVFINWVSPECHLPWPVLKRSDLYKHTLLVEGPNIRHTRQWDNDLLCMFTTVYTFWVPMVEGPMSLPMCKFARMNCHWLDFENALHCQQLVENCVYDRSVGMVLAHRPELQGTFVVRNTILHCLDPLRLKYIKDLNNATVYGSGWEAAASSLGPGVHVAGIDREHSTVDLLQRHTFALVVENVDALGYVSEKLYDCFMAGCIPIYYGNNDPVHVGIPTDMYIDLKAFESSAQLQQFLDTVDIASFKQRIHSRREAVLRYVSANYFAELVDSAVSTSSKEQAE